MGGMCGMPMMSGMGGGKRYGKGLGGGIANGMPMSMMGGAEMSGMPIMMEGDMIPKMSMMRAGMGAMGEMGGM
ncbi:hypothetical protein CHS0354_030402 [Potamilus streckersoni]|uniref:Uncharacterized protein n=1 Tax=Potamilus streckersoni TaxID=2493646 RepID=A0AAE0S9C7_9BIVA|nr:hypothetical protein CHS0354_030402 [Potamilus streckersoni]